MAEGFIEAVGPDGKKRVVPAHYLDNKAFGFRLPPSARATQEQAEPAHTELVQEQAAADTTEPKKEGRK